MPRRSSPSWASALSRSASFPFSSISSSLRACSCEPLHVGEVAPLLGDVVARLHRGDLLREIGEPGAQVARLALQLPPQPLVLGLLVALEQIAAAAGGRRSAPCRGWPDPPAAAGRSDRRAAARRSPARRPAWPTARRAARGRRAVGLPFSADERLRLLAQQVLQAIGDAGQRRPQRLAQNRRCGDPRRSAGRAAPGAPLRPRAPRRAPPAVRSPRPPRWRPARAAPRSPGRARAARPDRRAASPAARAGARGDPPGSRAGSGSRRRASATSRPSRPTIWSRSCASIR